MKKSVKGTVANNNALMNHRMFFRSQVRFRNSNVPTMLSLTIQSVRGASAPADDVHRTQYNPSGRENTNCVKASHAPTTVEEANIALLTFRFGLAQSIRPPTTATTPAATSPVEIILSFDYRADP